MRPVVILTMGRSGSSMTAGCLALHGLWTGVCKPADEFNPRGYFENLRFNSALGRLYRGSPYHDLKPMHTVRRWPQFVEAVQAKEGCAGGPWLVKVNAFTWPVWLPLDPIFVYVWRDVRSTVESSMKHGNDASRFKWFRTVFAHHEEQRRVKRLHGGFDVDTPKLLNGDYSQLEAITDYLGIPFNQSAVDQFINPEYWHGAK